MPNKCHLTWAGNSRVAMEMTRYFLPSTRGRGFFAGFHLPTFFAAQNALPRAPECGFASLEIPSRGGFRPEISICGHPFSHRDYRSMELGAPNPPQIHPPSPEGRDLSRQCRPPPAGQCSSTPPWSPSDALSLCRLRGSVKSSTR